MKKLAFMLPIAGLIAVIYLTGCTSNQPPVIESLDSDPAGDHIVNAGDTLTIVCTATDPDEDVLTYTWNVDAGTIVDPSAEGTMTWIAPSKSTVANIICTVDDVDTFDSAVDTLLIEVQNYFPMAVGNYWKFEGHLITPATLEHTIYSKEDMTEGRVRWHVERRFIWGAFDITDSFLYYTTFNDSVWITDPPDDEFLAYHLPFTINKTWSTGEDGTGTVVEIREYGTSAGGFDNSARVDIDFGSSTDDVTHWLAPDVGVIVTKHYSGETVINFELVEYNLE